MTNSKPVKFRRIWADILTLFLAIGIAFMTLLYVPSGSAGGPAWADKAFHAGAFFLLVLPGTIVHRWAFLWLVPLALAFGAAIEMVQPQFGRGRELEDFYADAAGVMAAVAVGTIIRVRRNRS